MNAKKCDRCGSYYMPGTPYIMDSKALKLLNGYTDLQMTLYAAKSDNYCPQIKCYDICYNCALDLDKWFMDKEEKTT